MMNQDEFALFMAARDELEKLQRINGSIYAGLIRDMDRAIGRREAALEYERHLAARLEV